MRKRSMAVLMVLVIIAPTVWVLASAVKLEGPGLNWSWSMRDPIVEIWPTVDGWAMGGPVPCRPPSSESLPGIPEERCDDLLELAARRLDRRDPGHAAVVEVVLHTYTGGIETDDDGRIISVHGARLRVARFELADGSVRAIGVGFSGVSFTARAANYGLGSR